MSLGKVPPKRWESLNQGFQKDWSPPKGPRKRKAIPLKGLKNCAKAFKKIESLSQGLYKRTGVLKQRHSKKERALKQKGPLTKIGVLTIIKGLQQKDRDP